MGSSGSMDYTLVSGTVYPSVGLLLGDRLRGPDGGRKTFDFGLAPGVTTTITESLTVKYFQRVYDIDNTQWCYYTKTSIDATPGTSETTPTNSGNITSASIVQILEIY